MGASYGGKIELLGWREYRNALKTIGAELQATSAKLKVVASSYDKSDKSVSAFAARSKALSDLLATQEKKWNLAKEAVQKFSTQVDATASKLQSRQALLEQERTKLQQIADQYGKASSQYKAQSEVVSKLEKEVAGLTNEYDQLNTQLNKTKAESDNAEAAMRKTAAAMDKLGKEAEAAGVNTDELGVAIQDSGHKAASAAGGGYTVFKNILANLATSVIQKVTDGVKNMASAVYEAGRDFDSGMSRVEAISGATADEMEQLTAKAKEMGATTKFTATQATDALYYMSMAGWKANDMLAGLPGVMNLAAASGEDLSRVSDIVTDALTAMGYQAKDSGRFADVLAASTANANVSVDTMGATFKYVGAVAGSFGYSMEDVAESIALLGNSGIKAEMAGTALRSVMMRLATDTGKATQAANELGVKITDSKGNMRDWSTVTDELRKSFSKLTDQQKSQYAKTIAGTEAMNGFLTLMNSTEADINKVRYAIQNSTGAADEMAKTMLDNVGGKMTLFKSKLESVYLVIWKKLEPTIKKFIDTASKALDKVDWEAWGEKAGKALQKVAAGFKWIIDNRRLIVGAVSAIVAAFAYSKIMDFTKAIGAAASGLLTTATGAKTATDAIKMLTTAQSAGTVATNALTVATNLFKAAWATNPIGVVVTGLALLAGGIIAVNKAMGQTPHGQFMNNMKEQREAIQEAKNSWDDLQTAQQEQINSSMTEITNYKVLKDELDGLIDKNGKVKKGYEERASFLVSTLADAFGVEISMQDGVVKGYDKISKAIDKLIEKKKAQAIIDSQEASYTEAVNKRAEATQRLTDLDAVYQEKLKALIGLQEKYGTDLNQITIQHGQGVAKRVAQAQDEFKAAKENYDGQQELLEQYTYNISTYEDNLAKFHAEKYSEMTTATWEWVKQFQGAGDAQKAQIEANIKNEEDYSAWLQKKYQETGDNVYKTEYENSQKRLKQHQQDLKQYTSATEEGLSKEKVVWRDGLDETLSTIVGKKVEFRDSGDGNVQAYVDGVKMGEPKSKQEMATLVTNAIKEITKKEPDAKTAGENVIEGVNKGISSQDKQNSVFRSIANFGSSLLGKLKAALKEKSPSKATEEMGVFLIKGLENGVSSEADNAMAQMRSLGTDMLNIFDEALQIAGGVSKVTEDKGKAIAKGVIDGVEKYKTVNKKKVKKTADELAKEYVSAANTRINELKKANNVTLGEEVTFWEKVVATCKKGTKGYDSAVAKLTTAKNNVKKQAQEVTEAYIEGVAKVNEQLEKDIAKLEEEYAKAVSQRQQAIVNSLGLFDEVKLDAALTTDKLIQNLQDQVNALAEWDATLDILKKRLGSDSGLLKDLEGMGVSALGNMQALAAMSEEELQTYVELYNEKQNIAKERAEKEAEELRKTTDEQIRKLQEDARKQITKLTNTYKEELKKMGANAKNASKQVGTNIAAGIKAGLDAQMPSVKASIIRQINEIVAAAKKAAKIKSPSRVFRDEIGKMLAAGIGVGFEDEMANVQKQMAATMTDLTTQMQAALPEAYSMSKLSDAYTKIAAPEQTTQVDAVEALKEALYQTKVVMDGDEMGRFVDKTVTNLVYN
jgi:TP901 family phage tail tape measure protein